MKNKRIQEINARLREMAKTIETENRELTVEEQQEFASLRRERDALLLQGAVTPVEVRGKSFGEVVQYLRDKANSFHSVELQLREAGATPTNDPNEHTMMTPDMAKGALVPLTVGEILYPVEEGLIWDKIGVRIPTGLSGEYTWPVVDDGGDATFAGEGVELDEVKVDITKINAVQQRLGVSMSETREAIFNSAGRVEEIIRRAIPRKVARTLNKVVLSPVKLPGQNLEGPLVKAKSFSTTFDYKGLNAAKAQLLALGYEESGMVWVMTAAQKAELETTPIDAGSGIMTVRDNKLCGLPIHISSIAADEIFLGDWRYQVMGQFGTPTMIYDPYTQAARNKVKFVFNVSYGTATLRQDAFLRVKKKA